MRDNQKQSFILYFDSCRCLKRLPAEQRGELFSALVDYAMTAAEGETPLDALSRFPALHEAGQLAFLLIAETIRRDTERWRQKRERYQEAAAKRWAEKSEKPDDMAYLRKIIQQRKPEED